MNCLEIPSECLTHSLLQLFERRKIYVVIGVSSDLIALGSFDAVDYYRYYHTGSHDIFGWFICNHRGIVASASLEMMTVNLMRPLIIHVTKEEGRDKWYELLDPREAITVGSLFIVGGTGTNDRNHVYDLYSAGKLDELIEQALENWNVKGHVLPDR